MTTAVFKKVDYTLDQLLSGIELGTISLPDIQRPFVWKAAKVRDLFDSMYQGFPVGYLLFWKNDTSESSKSIGVDIKQKPPKPRGASSTRLVVTSCGNRARDDRCHECTTRAWPISGVEHRPCHLAITTLTTTNQNPRSLFRRAEPGKQPTSIKSTEGRWSSAAERRVQSHHLRLRSKP